MRINTTFIQKDILKKATEFLITKDSELATIIRREKKCRLRLVKEPSPFCALVTSIAGQQLHAKAAHSILDRLKTVNKGRLPDADTLAMMKDDTLAQCGFSLRKRVALKTLAEFCLQGNCTSWQELQNLSNQQIIDRLIPLPGIGEWTVQMMLIFNLGRLNVMPTGDFGVREGWKRCKGWNEQPKPRQLDALTQHWQPYRSVGAWFLWREADRAKPFPRQNPLTR
ncbi:hypothetical protein COMNV_01033 [Commensalibacter sp. Nvir]|nr:hypothetical protein COMNV_01033 [Commensalibacter sp. Nvir]